MIGITKPMIRAIIAGLVLSTSISIVYLFLKRNVVLVPSSHTFISLTKEEQNSLIERLDKELGPGNYDFGIPRPMGNMNKVAEYFDTENLFKKINERNKNPQNPKTPKDKTLGFDKIIVVSEKKNRGNRSYIRKVAKEYGLSIDIVRSIEKEKENISELETHTSIWQQIVDIDLANGALILSDSIVFPKDIKKYAYQIPRALIGSNWSLLYLNNPDNKDEGDNTKKVLYDKDIKIVNTHLQSYAYAISSSCAKQLLDELSQEENKYTSVKQLIDNMISEQWVTAYSSKWNIVTNSDPAKIN
ncbi:hypothetical protein BB559_006735 [Furculomyces boomerangus]|uniref:Uncharacterized protein n=2 Tax=Harpellales TaxID=61421 RepID=A0A2T9Y0T5_9FUNG|nr:hypothetical protein BB559_006735 [Furculomyces boomerangus]PWA03162.1 hypothetical protein BB558_000681 [Smittium angustum]